MYHLFQLHDTSEHPYDPVVRPEIHGFRWN